MTTTPAADGRREGVGRAGRAFPVVGIVGGGQLARMCQPPAVALSVTLSVLARSTSESAALVVPDVRLGEPDDLAAIRGLAADADVVTFDHEHVPDDVLAALVAEGVSLRPAPTALVHAQDKTTMRRRLDAAGIPCPRWTLARTDGDVSGFAAEVGWPLIAKTPRGGYDGKGVRRIDGADQLSDWLELVGLDGPLEEGVLLEESVDFRREVAALVARGPGGQVASWSPVETVQADGICTEVLAPAPGLSVEAAHAATALAERIAAELDVTGVMAVELFELDGGGSPGTAQPTFLVNELAMRPHNSGHWTIDGAVTSQFEQHLRAVLDLPLGATTARSAWTVMANVLGGARDDLHGALAGLMATDPDLRVHLYGKEVREGRKIGHVTVCGDDLDELRARARRAADILRGADA